MKTAFETAMGMLTLRQVQILKLRMKDKLSWRAIGERVAVKASLARNIYRDTVKGLSEDESLVREAADDAAPARACVVCEKSDIPLRRVTEFGESGQVTGYHWICGECEKRDTGNVEIP